MTEAKPQNYWISPTALRISLNALSDADYMQASAASGAMIMCYMKGIDGLEYDHGHNYKRWPLKISQTYFTTTTRKYVYIRIPKPGTDVADVETDTALVIYPSERVDIYGMTADGRQLLDTSFYYIWTQGIISASEATSDGLRRHWEQEIVTGTLASDEATEAGGTGEWWSYDPLTGMVTFLKTIASATFEYMKAAQAEIHNLSVTGTLDAIKGFIDDIRSHNFQSGMLDGSGFRLTSDNGEGASELEVDLLKVRKKATFMELEVREETFVGGNQHYSPAGSIIYRVEYMTENDEPLGYSVMKVPFLLKNFAFLGRLFNYAARKRIRHALSDEEWRKVHHFRCYLIADDGTTATRNWWKVGDQARCQSFNKAVSAANKRANTYNWKKDHLSDDPSTPMPDYTTTEGPIETAYYWRTVDNVGSETLDDGYVYDFVDFCYEGWDIIDASGVRHYYTEDDKRGFRDAGSGIPVAGDTIVCMGNRADQDRMNMISLYTSGSDNHPPAIKGYRGIHTFNVQQANKVFEISPNEFLVRSRVFKLLDDSGYQFPVPLERGEFVLGVRYHWYDRVSWKGSIWLCMQEDDYLWEDANGNNYEEWRVENIEYGEGEFGYLIEGLPGQTGIYTGTDHYYQKGKVNGTTVYYVKRYTYSEPDKHNALWLWEVRKGTEITTVETAYAASKSGTSHPADGDSAWKVVGTGEGQYATAVAAIAATGIDDPQHKNGVYLWTRIKTFYDDPNDPDRPAEVEYTVVRWGIDADGIYQINSYYLARLSTASIDSSSDNFPMPGDSGWSSASANAKWFDTFSACAAANGGVGAMQGWLVWEKTVIIYDPHYDKDGNVDTNPDIITYKSSRIGQDGQIGQEEYYMLSEYNEFSKAFPNSSGKKYPGYDKIGIRWYKQSNPASENWRLSDTTPNINLEMWSSVMPTYDKAVHGKKIYLWNFEQRVDGQGTEYATKPICIGNHARGIKGVIELYALSSSQTPMSEAKPIPSDINSKNTWGVIPTSGFEDPQVWSDEKYDRAPTEALPYQWNWTRTLYSAQDENGKDYEDHYHVSAVKGTAGEDGAGKEFIYCRPQSHNADGTEIAVTLPDPNILKDKDGTTCTAAYIKKTDDFIPYKYTDNPVGIDFTHQVEYQCERKSKAVSGGFSSGHEWELFSAPKPWSKWGKNGQDGDGVEYVFIRTTSGTAPTIVNSADSRKDSAGRTYLDDDYLPLAKGGSLSGNVECTDEPAGTDANHPYEWVCKRTKTTPNAETGVRTWKKYSGTMSLWANFADSPWVADLSNEFDGISCEDRGYVTVAQSVSTDIILYYGSTKKTFSVTSVKRNGTAITIGTVTDGVTVTYSNGTLTVAYTDGALISGKDEYDITIKATDDTSIVRTVKFVVNGVKGDVYNLRPVTDILAAQRDESGKVVLADGSSVFSMTCGYTEKDAVTGAVTIPSTDVTERIDGRYNIYFRRRRRSDGKWNNADNLDRWYLYTNATYRAYLVITTDEGGTQSGGLNVNTYDAVEFVLCGNTASYRTTEQLVNIIDRETVSIVADGMNGTSPWVADLDNEMDSVACNLNGKPAAAATVTTNLSMYYGSNKKKFRITGVTRNGSDSMGTGVTISPSSFPTSYATSKSFSVTYATTATISSKDDFAITLQPEDATSETRVLHFTINGIRPGANGEPAVLYNLQPDQSAINIGRSGSAYNPSTASVYCGYTKNVGGTITEIPDAAGQTASGARGRIDSKYYIYYRKHIRSSQAWQTYYYRYGYYVENEDASAAYKITGFSVETYDAVEFIICTANVDTRFSASNIDNYIVIDKETIPVVSDGVKGDKGENAVRIDLDNENDTMLYAGDGTLVSGNVVSTGYLYDGSTDVSASATWSIKSKTGCTASISGRKVTVTAMSATSGSVVVQAVYNEQTYTATLTLKKITDGDKYELVITPNSIAYNTSTDTPAASTLAIQVWKTSVNSSGGSTRALSAPPSGYKVYAGSTELTASSTGTYSHTTDNSAISEVQVKIAKSTSSTDILDAETIPVNKAKNGSKGNTGDTGHVGRWYYYAGVYDGTPSHYKMEKTRSPYVKESANSNNFWMLDFGGVEPDSHEKTATKSPTASGQTEWTSMLATFRYIISEAVFAENAKLGSFVFNGDWMISTDGSPSNKTYADFNPSGFTTYVAGTNPSYAGFIPNYAVDGKTGTTYQRKGFIGGFTIGATTLTNSDWNAGIDISYDSKNVKIGKNAAGTVNTEQAIIRAENTESNQTYNTALYLNAQNATYNYAFYGNGNGVLNGLVFGYRIQNITIPSGSSDASADILLRNGSTVVLTGTHSSGNVKMMLPKLAEVRACLGISDTTTHFAIEINILNRSNYGHLYIGFSETTGTNTTYPRRMSFDDSAYSGNDAYVQLAQGDYMKIMLTYSGSVSSKYYNGYILIRNY